MTENQIVRMTNHELREAIRVKGKTGEYVDELIQEWLDRGLHIGSLLAGEYKIKGTLRMSSGVLRLSSGGFQ